MKSESKLTFRAAIRRFGPFARPHGGYAVGFVLVAFVALGVNLAQAGLLERLIDAALGLEGNLLAAYALFYAGALFADLVAAFLQKYLYGGFSAHFQHDLQYHAIDHLQAISPSVMEKHHSGDLLSRLTNDLSVVQEFASSTLLDAFKQLLMLAAAASYMAYLNWKLLLVSVLVVPLALAVIGVLTRPMRGYWTKAWESIGKANSVAQDALGGIFTVKAYNLQAALSRKYLGYIEKGMEYDIKAANVLRWIPPFNILLRAMPTVLCIGYGSFLIVRGELTPGELIAFNFLLGFVQWPLAFLPDMINRIKRGMSASERVAEVLDIPAERPDGSDFSKEETPEALRFDGVSFAYGDGPPVLNELSFELMAGEKIALVGPSGCGKSTILKLLCGDYENHGGEIRVLGRDTRQWELVALRAQFAMISQDIFLFPDTIMENIAYGRRDASSEEVYAAAKIANAHEFIEKLPDGYGAQVGERGIKLSGGQKQRIALARAILKGAPVLLLDEPTSALDTHSEALVQEAIERSLRGKTAIIIAHRISTIKKVDRILVMDRGSIVEQGSHDELFARNGLYAKLYMKQFNSAENEPPIGSTHG